MTSQLRGRALAVAALSVGALLSAPAGLSQAATPASPVRPASTIRPASALPQTVSADPLPTVQVDGVVWAEVTVGNTVYATGSFKFARPAGAAAGSASQVARANLLAFDLTTGNLITTFAHTLNAQGRIITVSPDGNTLYVGGNFTTVDGLARGHIAAFDIPTGNLITTFAPTPNNVVLAIAATATTVYTGGTFTKANGVARNYLAAFTTTGALTAWTPTTTGAVTAMIMAPDQSRLVIGGGFYFLDGNVQPGIGTVDPTTGATMNFPYNFPVQNPTINASITGFSTDGTTIYSTAYSYGDDGNFEGRFAFDPDSGSVLWLADCHGDSYASIPIGGILYSASHEHDCSDIGSFSQNSLTVPASTKMHAEAETLAATGVNTAPLFLGGGPDRDYSSFAGQPAPTQLNWYPNLAIGKVTGQSQAAWSVAGNANYVAFGGEFPTVNGKAQAGLVRFALRSLAPNKVAPAAIAAPVAASVSSGAIRVTWKATSDQDDTTLTYALYRDTLGTPIYTTSADSSFWNTPALGYVDSGQTLGSSHTYFVKATDPSGNSVTSLKSAAVVVGAATQRAYLTTVSSDSPSGLWPLSEATGTNAYDYAGFSPLTLGAQVAPAAVGPFTQDPATADSYSGVLNPVGAKSDGTPPSSSSVSYSVSTGTVAPTNTFSLEAWVKTSSTSGGLVVGEGLYPKGDSAATDRVLYLDASGKPYFGLTAAGVHQSLAGVLAINDGKWHHLVGTAGPSGATLYVDGIPMATSSTLVDDARWPGYWRVGGDNLLNWPSNPTSGFLAATIADVAVYPTVLGAGRVLAHYLNGSLGL